MFLISFMGGREVLKAKKIYIFFNFFFILFSTGILLWKISHILPFNRYLYSIELHVLQEPRNQINANCLQYCLEEM